MNNQAISYKLTARSSTRVLIFGTFDLFHEGHRDLIAQAARHGDELFVVVARDTTVLRMKGFFPTQNERERLASVGADPHVTNARLGYAVGSPMQVVDDIAPQVICLGYDQRGFADALPAHLAARGVTISVIRLKAYKPEMYKSSLLRLQYIQ